MTEAPPHPYRTPARRLPVQIRRRLPRFVRVGLAVAIMGFAVFVPLALVMYAGVVFSHAASCTVWDEP